MKSRILLGGAALVALSIHSVSGLADNTKTSVPQTNPPKPIGNTLTRPAPAATGASAKSEQVALPPGRPAAPFSLLRVPPIDYEGKVLIAVCNDAFGSSSGIRSLIGPKLDCSTIEAIAPRLSFRVKILRNGTPQQLIDAIAEAKNLEMLVVWVSSHGISVNNRNLVLYPGATAENPESSSIEVASIESEMTRANPRHGVLALDVCRKAFDRDPNAGSRGNEVRESFVATPSRSGMSGSRDSEGSVIVKIYGTLPDNLAFEDARGGVFTRAFWDAILASGSRDIRMKPFLATVHERVRSWIGEGRKQQQMSVDMGFDDFLFGRMIAEDSCEAGRKCPVGEKLFHVFPTDEVFCFVQAATRVLVILDGSCTQSLGVLRSQEDKDPTTFEGRFRRKDALVAAKLVFHPEIGAELTLTPEQKAATVPREATRKQPAQPQAAIADPVKPETLELTPLPVLPKPARDSLDTRRPKA